MALQHAFYLNLYFFYEWSYQVFCCGYYFFFILTKHLQSQSPYPHRPAVCPTAVGTWASLISLNKSGTISTSGPSRYDSLYLEHSWSICFNCLPPLLQVKAQVSLFFFGELFPDPVVSRCAYTCTHTKKNLGTLTSFSSFLVLSFSPLYVSRNKL